MELQFCGLNFRELHKRCIDYHQLYCWDKIFKARILVGTPKSTKISYGNLYFCLCLARVKGTGVHMKFITI